MSTRTPAPCGVWPTDPTTNNSPVQQAAANQAKYQQWNPVLLGSGYYEFVDTNSGLCLTVPGGAATKGLQLQISTCAGSPSQSFAVGSLSTIITAGAWYEVLSAKSGFCVTDPNSATAQWHAAYTGYVRNAVESGMEVSSSCQRLRRGLQRERPIPGVGRRELVHHQRERHATVVLVQTISVSLKHHLLIAHSLHPAAHQGSVSLTPAPLPLEPG